MAQRSILVIDDEVIWHGLLRKLLGGAGYNVYTAATCAEGVKLAEFHKPDCILSDFHLPDGDAVSVCSALRASENVKNIPVIIFSSDPDAEITAYAQCHAGSFILKGPAALAALTRAIESILRPIVPTGSG